MSEYLYIVVPKDSDVQERLPAFVKEKLSGHLLHNMLVDLHLNESRAEDPRESYFEFKIGSMDLWNLRTQKKKVHIVVEILTITTEYLENIGIPFRFEEHVFRKKRTYVHQVDKTEITTSLRKP